MFAPLVLVTGANGLIGFGIVAKALASGYHVRAVVRRPEAAKSIEAASTLAPYFRNGALNVELVLESTKPGAYIQVVRGCDFIVHVASPLPNKEAKDRVKESLDATKRILEAAESCQSVRRVVFTSSIYAILDYSSILSGQPTLKANADTRLDTTHINITDACPHAQYNKAKAAAKNFIEDYVSSNRPEATHFSIVNVLPGFVVGPSQIQTTKAQVYTNSSGFLAAIWFDMAPILGSFLGQEGQKTVEIWTAQTHIDDCVDAHINALDTINVPGKLRNFLLCADEPYGSEWASAESIVESHLPGIAKTINFVPCTLSR